MTDQKSNALDCVMSAAELDVGRPVEWMVDPDHREKILGVTYAFSHTGERKTVWYTANKRRAKNALLVTDLVSSTGKISA
ncbi:hypothetical protein GCM10007291_43230 [Gemmobacter nanjingensis]|uniref:Uncharacterized protein n=1 Tax=Gemmobacter nanjingensis TaxID=488454 RepID=A0ABQ3FRU4_9RHOB|nr:hypothetical protein [Gemmobacter nanjingensis]GHC37058.1 hypothetical protein GCM10007291_43230 [Gemmobacter nanjingensis]